MISNTNSFSHKPAIILSDINYDISEYIHCNKRKKLIEHNIYDYKYSEEYLIEI